ncbi:TerC family protein [Paraburkholderia guartelaensis]|jgi:YjbE family integral membrane protein|uniref:TerC family protein n=1 Tax=Paraburkholderia guartelaensis TaxID=2546446 RepID=A0A4R5LGY8_9BURK|nr:TerC family protein [Paraburkholderia guartelaensis]TDG08512.1 TerC family protein [Paraburkholderia guartelaensis]
MLEFFASLHWGAVFQIIVIDILLGGDNAVVIALACRDLPSQQRVRGILWGTAGAIALRVVLIAFAVVLLNVPFLKFAGGLLLLWIGVRLLAPSQLEHANVKPAEKLMGAIKTIVVADAVMSLDNVVAIAGAAEAADPRHRIALVIFGLMVSIPLIVWGSQLVLKLLDRYPVIVTLGAALLGWIAGGLIVNDPAGDRWPLLDTPAAEYGMCVAGAVFVVALGTWLRRRNARRSATQGPQSH